MTQLLRLLIVDDHEVVRLGMRALLERHPSFSVVGEASTQEEAVTMALEHQPDIVLMDIRLAGGSGIEACQQIKDQLPQTKVIMLTSFAEDELLFAAIRAGATGYLLKQIAGGTSFAQSKGRHAASQCSILPSPNGYFLRSGAPSRRKKRSPFRI